MTDYLVAVLHRRRSPWLAYLLGMIEFRLCCTWADPMRTDDDGYTALDDAYDRGRDMAHRITLRRCE